MNTQQRVKREMVYASVFIVVGIVAGLVGLLFRESVEMGVIIGLVAGFLPVGVGLLVVYRQASKDPQAMRRIALEQEERSQYIRGKAGYSAFWIVYWIMFVYVMANLLIDIPFEWFGVLMMFIMPVVYFTSLSAFNKNY